MHMCKDLIRCFWGNKIWELNQAWAWVHEGDRELNIKWKYGRDDTWIHLSMSRWDETMTMTSSRGSPRPAVFLVAAAFMANRIRRIQKMDHGIVRPGVLLLTPVCRRSGSSKATNGSSCISRAETRESTCTSSKHKVYRRCRHMDRLRRACSVRPVVTWAEVEYYGRGVYSNLVNFFLSYNLSIFIMCVPS